MASLCRPGNKLTTLPSTWCLAASIGPVIGGSLATQGQWRWIFCEYHDLVQGAYEVFK